MSQSAQSPPRKNAAKAAFFAWLVPGLGHIYQGRTSKGIVFFICLMATFIWGMYLGEWKVVYWAWDERKPVVEGLCRLGMGLPTVASYLQSFQPEGKGLPLLGHFQAAPSSGDLNELNARLNTQWDIAKVYTMIACLLNVLVILDAFAGPAEPSVVLRETGRKQESSL